LQFLPFRRETTEHHDHRDEYERAKVLHGFPP
jgi:hypothetical protein